MKEQYSGELVDLWICWARERGVTRKEVAARLGLSVWTVRDRELRAREQWGLEEMGRALPAAEARERGDPVALLLGEGVAALRALRAACLREMMAALAERAEAEGWIPALAASAGGEGDGEGVAAAEGGAGVEGDGVKPPDIKRRRAAALQRGRAGVPALIGELPAGRLIVTVSESLRRHAEMIMRLQGERDGAGEFERFQQTVLSVLEEVDPALRRRVRERLIEERRKA